MKIISWNVNGLRAVRGRGFLGWLKKSGADVVCLQEIKLQEKNLSFFRELEFPYYRIPVYGSKNRNGTRLKRDTGFFVHWNFAQKPGYSGTAVFTKQKPLKIVNKIGLPEFDNQGRILRLDFKDFILINLYLPHGGRDKSTLPFKLKAYRYLIKYLKNLDSRFRGNDKKVVLAGDFNVAHTELDLARPRQNKNNIMFTPKERAQIDKLLALGFEDIYRKQNPKKQEFTWWPYLANARTRNLGWRIDYFFASKSLAKKLKKVAILSKIKGSDHCPIEVNL